MNAVGIFFLVLIFGILLPIGAWVGYTRWRAHQQGLPPPPLSAYIPFSKSSSSGSSYPIAPRPGGITGWVQDKYNALKNRGSYGGTARGEYEEAGGRARGGFAQLDPEGAWDDRVGHEGDAYGRIGDYEEQELAGGHPAQGPYAGQGYGARAAPEYDDEPRGRSRSRYDEEVELHVPAGDGRSERANPFGDEAEPSSLRGVSPRPVELEHSDAPAADQQLKPGHKKKGSGDTHHSSRKSMFQESL